jgi:hypothetical protein
MSSVTTMRPAPTTSRKSPSHDESESWKWSGVLGAREIATSSDLLRRLEQRGISRANARQVLAREFTTSNGVWRSEQLRLEAGGRLYAYKSFYGDAPFLEAIRPILQQNRRGVGRVLAAIEKLPAVDIDLIKKLTAVDLRSDSTALKRELEAIEEVGLGALEDSTTARQRLVRFKYAGQPEGENLAFQLLAEAESEQHWISLLLHHLSCQNLVSWKSHESRYTPTFNGRLFSAVAYSYVKPLVRFEKGNPTPIACPVVIDVLSRTAETFDVEGMVERMYRAGANAQARLRLMGVIGAPHFTPEAFQLARKSGLLVVNFREVFGEAALEMLASAESLFREMHVAKSDNGDATQISALATKLSDSVTKLKDHPLVTALSGLAFESFAAVIARARGYEDVHSGEKAPFFVNGNETMREIDVHGHRADEWLVIECKALNAKKELDRDSVKYFFTETVPAFRTLKGKVNVAKCRAELWTTGKVTDDLRDYLKDELRLPRGVDAAILSAAEIAVPKPLRPLSRMLTVLGAL